MSTQLTPTPTLTDAIAARCLIKGERVLLQEWRQHCRERGLCCPVIHPHRSGATCSVSVSWPNRTRLSRDLRDTMGSAVAWAALGDDFDVCNHEAYMPRVRVDQAEEIVRELIALYEGEMGSGAWD